MPQKMRQQKPNWKDSFSVVTQSQFDHMKNLSMFSHNIFACLKTGLDLVA